MAALAWRGGLSASRGTGPKQPIRFDVQKPLRHGFQANEGARTFWSVSAASLLSLRRAHSKTLGGHWRNGLRVALICQSCLPDAATDDHYIWADGVLEEVPLQPVYLAKQLAPALLHINVTSDSCTAVSEAGRLLGQLSLEVAHILTLRESERDGRLDGLMDLSPVHSSKPKRKEQRRRLHQALNNMVRWFLHDPDIYLSGLERDASPERLREFAAEAIVSKRSLRRLSQSNVAFSTKPPSDALPSSTEVPDVDAAAVHGLKQWSKAFKQWCFDTIVHFFLLDPSARARWLTGRRSDRSRVTILSAELRRAVAAKRREGLLPLPQDQFAGLLRQLAGQVLVDRPRVLDVGSCNNYFGRLHGQELEVTAVDMAPGHHSVLSCNFLDLPLSPAGSSFELQGQELGGYVAKSLPAGHFDVVIMALFFSILPGPEARGIAAAKARQLLAASGRGLLIIADTKGTVGRHGDKAARSSAWVKAVEANGFKLARDPQLHLSKEHVKGRPGFWQRAFCWSFVTAPHADENVVPTAIPLLSDARKPRALSPERLQAQQLRQAKKEARASKAKLRKLLTGSKRLVEERRPTRDVNEESSRLLTKTASGDACIHVALSVSVSLSLSLSLSLSFVACHAGLNMPFNVEPDLVKYEMRGKTETFDSTSCKTHSLFARLRRPAVTIHDIPDELEEIEVWFSGIAQAKFRRPLPGAMLLIP